MNISGSYLKIKYKVVSVTCRIRYICKAFFMVSFIKQTAFRVGGTFFMFLVSGFEGGASSSFNGFFPCRSRSWLISASSCCWYCLTWISTNSLCRKMRYGFTYIVADKPTIGHVNLYFFYGLAHTSDTEQILNKDYFK